MPEPTDTRERPSTGIDVEGESGDVPLGDPCAIYEVVPLPVVSEPPSDDPESWE